MTKTCRLPTGPPSCTSSGAPLKCPLSSDRPAIRKSSPIPKTPRLSVDNQPERALSVVTHYKNNRVPKSRIVQGFGRYEKAPGKKVVRGAGDGFRFTLRPAKTKQSKHS